MVFIGMAATGCGGPAQKVGQATSGPVAAETAAPEVVAHVTPAPVAPKAAAPAPAAQTKTFKLGDIVRQGTLEAAAVSVQRSWVPDNQFETAKEGKRLAAVEFQLKNNGSKAEQISTLMQFKLKDATNAQYGAGFFAPDPKFPDGELAPGDTARGFVSFEIPQGSSGLRFLFDAEVFGAGQIAWALGI